jgi:hypothetical protein
LTPLASEAIATTRSFVHWSEIDKRPCESLMHSSTVWNLVRRYAAKVSIAVPEFGGRAICTLSLCKAAITHAIERGA